MRNIIIILIITLGMTVSLYSQDQSSPTYQSGPDGSWYIGGGARVSLIMSTYYLFNYYSVGGSAHTEYFNHYIGVLFRYRFIYSTFISSSYETRLTHFLDLELIARIYNKNLWFYGLGGGYKRGFRYSTGGYFGCVSLDSEFGKKIFLDKSENFYIEPRIAIQVPFEFYDFDLQLSAVNGFHLDFGFRL